MWQDYISSLQGRVCTEIPFCILLLIFFLCDATLRFATHPNNDQCCLSSFYLQQCSLDALMLVILKPTLLFHPSDFADFSVLICMSLIRLVIGRFSLLLLLSIHPNIYHNPESLTLDIKNNFSNLREFIHEHIR